MKSQKTSTHGCRVVKNQVTGEGDLREPVAGEYKSAEREAQKERFTSRSIELSNASRNNRPAPVLN